MVLLSKTAQDRAHADKWSFILQSFGIGYPGLPGMCLPGRSQRGEVENSMAVRSSLRGEQGVGKRKYELQQAAVLHGNRSVNR